MSKTGKKNSFEQRVLEVVSRIPRGLVMTYREVAEVINDSKSARAVGSVLRKNRNPDTPCFRVVRSDGSPGQYNRGKKKKELLLRAEGSLDSRGRVRRYFSDRFTPLSQEAAMQKLRSGGVGVIPTDTIYGVVCRAEDSISVARVYQLRKRNPHKPCIILISDYREMNNFGVSMDAVDKRVFRAVWPGPVSVIVPCTEERFTYLHRGVQALAFRLPDDEDLLGILRATGPLLAPSANIEGRPAAKTVREAYTVFGRGVDVYIDGLVRVGQWSTLIACEKGGIVLKRPGKVDFSDIQKKLKKL